MKIGIHESSGSFSDRWIAYCKAKSINYKSVNCYANDIIDQLSDCDALMWHFNHKGAKDSKFARQLMYAVQASGKSVFPDFNTAWHFDDKVGQKYLLESIQAPMVPSFVFYRQSEAIEWAQRTTYPKVFKLRTGAGSDNVKLINSEQAAIRYIKRSFGKGFKQYRGWSNLKERFRKYRIGKTTLFNVFKGVVRLGYTTEFARVTGPEKGYAYFQEFIPNNNHDIRVVVIGNRAVALKRMVRENDFRASGSGSILYEKELFNEETIKLSFDISKRLQAQCVAYDFVHDNGQPLLVEISYGFAPEGYDPCPGYWDSELNWHRGKADLYGWMIEDLMMISADA